MKNPSQHIIITGATGGIGAACTKLFRSRGHAVSTWDIPEVDVTDIHQVTEQFRQDVDKHGPVAALVHCAGVMEPDSATNPQNTRNMTIN